MIKQQRERKGISYEDVLNRATEIFGYDKNKALIWYMEKSPRYGNKSPHEMCKSGAFRQVIKDLESYAF